MNTAAPARTAMNTDYINPVISATLSVFEMMLGCKPTRTGLLMKDDCEPKYELSAVIGVTGKAAGTIVFSISEKTALEVLNRMVGIEATEVDADVLDAEIKKEHSTKPNKNTIGLLRSCVKTPP